MTGPALVPNATSANSASGASSSTTPAVKPGAKSSEFWLSLLALLGVAVTPVTDTLVQNGTTTLTNHGSAGIIAAAAIAAAYTVGRSLVKAAAATAAPAPAAPPDSVAIAPESR